MPEVYLGTQQNSGPWASSSICDRRTHHTGARSCHTVRVYTSPSELDDHRAQVSTGWISRYGLMYFGQNIAWSTPSQLLIANQILIWHPGNKEQLLGWLMGVGGITSMAGSLIVGVLSDRTHSRFGRRAPWVLGGAIAAAAALLGAAFAPGYAFLFAIWAFFQLVLAFSITSAQTIPPDRVPTQQYGTISGVMGVTYTIAVVAGSVVGAMLSIKIAYLITAAVLMCGVLPFLLVDRDQPSTKIVERKAHGPLLPKWSEATDFWWVFITRLLVTMAQAIALFYLLYYLRDRIGMKTDAANQGVMILSIVYAVCVIITAVWSGRSSDRSGRRKIYVGLSSAGVAIAALILVFAQEFSFVIIAAIVLGMSWGVYQAIDQALINQILPSEEDRAKDMGLMNLAVAIPNAAAPFIAAQVLAQGLGYAGLYIIAAGLTLTGAVLIVKVKGVR